jgi:DNA polymerase I
MSNSKGEPTNAIFGFTRDLKTLRDIKSPSHLICAMDSPGKGIRNDWYEEYKMNRSAMPEDLRPQIQVIADVIKGFNIPVIQMESWEADDVIATLTRQATERGMDVRIVTSDKDARQLLSPQVQIFNVRKNSYFTEEDLQETWGIRPDQVVDFQSIVGDSSDNIPGVPLVGPKKAQILIEKFGDLDNILANADQAKGKKLQENLKTYAEQAHVCKKLVTLYQDLPIELNWDDAKLTPPNSEKLLAIFQNCGFQRLTEEFKANSNTNSPAPVQKKEWKSLDTKNKFDSFYKELKKQNRFCVDMETTSLRATEADIVGWAICWEAGIGFYIPVDGPTGQNQVDAEYVIEKMKPILENPEIEKINQNIKYDMLVLLRAGIHLQGIGMDPMVGDYLLDAGARGHGLDKLAEKYLQHEMIPITELIGKGKQQKKMFEVDIDKAAEYAAEDADITFQVAEIVSEKLKKEKLWDLYWDLERPLISVLVDMEHRGIKVNPDELKQQSIVAGKRVDELVKEIYEIAGHEFNIDSPKQLSVVLFEELNLPVLKKTKTGASTNQEVLEKLALMHPLPEKIMEKRQLSKLKSTYLDALPELIHPETGRIHASFNQVVTATGRLSSSNPNLQNIPIRTEEGRKVRRAFIPGEEGWKLLCADYSQIELRILANFCHDHEMSKAFREGVDIHTAVASEIFLIPENEVDAEKRRIAKAVNFGVIYGQSPFGLAATLGIDQPTAAAFIESYFNQYADVDTFFHQLLEDCKKKGYVTTILGRQREISGIKNTTGRLRNLPERTAINTVIQGSAADLIKKAMIHIQDRLHAENHPAHMLLQIHDELIFETPIEEMESLQIIVKEEMENALEMDVPLVVDMKTGLNWLDAEPVNLK